MQHRIRCPQITCDCLATTRWLVHHRAEKQQPACSGAAVLTIKPHAACTADTITPERQCCCKWLPTYTQQRLTITGVLAVCSAAPKAVAAIHVAHQPVPQQNATAKKDNLALQWLLESYIGKVSMLQTAARNSKHDCCHNNGNKSLKYIFRAQHTVWLRMPDARCHLPYAKSHAICHMQCHVYTQAHLSRNTQHCLLPSSPLQLLLLPFPTASVTTSCDKP